MGVNIQVPVGSKLMQFMAARKTNKAEKMLITNEWNVIKHVLIAICYQISLQILLLMAKFVEF